MRKGKNQKLLECLVGFLVLKNVGGGGKERGWGEKLQVISAEGGESGGGRSTGNCYSPQIRAKTNRWYRRGW